MLRVEGPERTAVRIPAYIQNISVIRIPASFSELEGKIFVLTDAVYKLGKEVVVAY
jgi:hypothetical protein